MKSIRFFLLSAIIAISASLFVEASPYEFHFEGHFKDLYMAGRFTLLKKMLNSDDVILEAGGFDGKDSIKLAEIVPEGKLISFEPNPPRFRELVERTKEIINVSAYPFALGEKTGTATFYVCYGAQNDPVYEGASSLLPPSEAMKINYQGPRIQVPCYRLDDWCKEYQVNKIDFMWLDLEGFEMQMLKNGKEILSTVRAIYVETNFFEFRKGMTQYQELRRFLKRQGFRLLAHGYNKGYQGNAIFVRSNQFKSIVKKIQDSR